MLVDEYSELKHSIVELAEGIPQSVLRTLIDDFEHEINSKRRSSLIRNCSDLITVLEKRGVVDSSRCTLLQKIVERLPPRPEREAMLARLNGNTSRPRHYTPSNQYVPQSRGNQFAPMDASLQYTSTQRPNYEGSPGILPDEVIELISEEIGTKWPDMARKLKLREADINRIRDRYAKDTYQCAQQCLLHFQSKCDRYELEKNLLWALEKARRNDIRNKVQKMLYRPNT